MQNNDTAGKLLKLECCEQTCRREIIALGTQLQTKQQQAYRFGQLHYSILMETNQNDNRNRTNASWLVKYPAVTSLLNK